MNTTINSDTKIADILRSHPDALEAIISISPKFNKLRNPLLRRLMASRTSISMASKIGGCSANDFFDKLQPLGFIIDRTIAADDMSAPSTVPEFLINISADDIVELDVREILESGKDPFNLILEHIKRLKAKQVLKLINSFEPIPLIQLLEKKGYKTYSEVVNADLVFTYFFNSEQIPAYEQERLGSDEDWDGISDRFKDKIVTIDVRALEMPLPMLTILDSLENLPDGKALYVYHKRIPVFLLPELQERKFEYRIKEISDSEVHLLIFKP
ncbi:hypothetical protein MASR2M18_05530 [Ignavibacteria bacterium]|jgi:uncharacterized protein (DUF2249 family)|nr:DUF2249 domain-containing protein [Bacteroidota bacterium]MCZ2132074.1 DUF2249 domain-containing protein [Bacteroidota bacterium]